MSDHQPELFVEESAAEPKPVQSQLRKTEDVIRSVVGDLFKDIDAGRSDGWKQQVTESAKRLQELVSVPGFEPEGRFETRIQAYRAVRELRARVEESVIRELYVTLREAASSGHLQARVDQSVSQLERAIHALPEIIERTEPGALFEAREADSQITKARKAGIRMARAMTPGNAAKTHVQRLTIRRDALYHMHVDVVPAIKQSVETTLDRYIRSLAGLEATLMNWVHAVLDAERLLDQAEYHYPEGEFIPITEPVEPPKESAETSKAEKKSNTVPPVSAVSNDSQEDTGKDKKTVGYREAIDLLREANQEFLETLLSLDAGAGAWTGERSLSIDNAIDRFKTGVQSSGTFMSTVSELESTPLVALGQLSPRYAPWIEEAASRFEYCLAILDVRNRMVGLQNHLISTLAEASVAPLVQAYGEAAQHINELHSDAISVFEQAVRIGGKSDIGQQLDGWQERAVAAVQEGIISRVGSLKIKDRLSEVVEESREKCNSLSALYPESFTVHELQQSSSKKFDLKDEPYALEFRGYVVGGIDDALDARLTTAPDTLFIRIKEALKSAAEIPDIIAFNLGEARTELQGGEDTLESAKELTLNGLARSSESLLVEQKKLAEPLRGLTDTAFALFDDSWRKMHARARVENQARKYLVDAKSQIEEQRRVLISTLQSRASDFLVRARKLFRILRKRVQELIRMGRAAVGEAEHQELSFQETIEALSALDELLELVPQVYRRLFSFNPVVEADLLVGRETDRLTIAKHVQKWKNGVTQSLVLSGSPSSGRTSFLNVLKDTVFRDADVMTVVLKTRILDEVELTGRLVEALGMADPGSPRPTTLDELNTALLEMPRTGELRVLVIEHIEHLFLKTIGGTSMLARLLTMMSRTDSRILWIGTISDFGWQYMMTSEGATTSLVSRHKLSDLDRKSMEKLILSRHRKSGYKLVFEQGDVTNPLMKRRLKKAATEEEKQAILQDAYFDRLHAQCGQNIMLALYYWIRSITVNEDESGVSVKALDAIKFAFLGAFSLQQATALKALLDHGSLTIEEYSIVSQIDPEESIAVFESFANALLIETLDDDATPDHFHFLSVSPSTRYRIRPLIVHPVVQFLRGKNIVH